jgi:hypothetical protein
MRPFAGCKHINKDTFEKAVAQQNSPEKIDAVELQPL